MTALLGVAAVRTCRLLVAKVLRSAPGCSRVDAVAITGFTLASPVAVTDGRRD